MNFKIAGAFIAILAGSGLLFLKQPSLESRMLKLEPGLNKQIQSRQFHVDPAELIKNMYDNHVKLTIIDVRDEADYNLFNIIDSKRTTLDRLKNRLWVDRNLPVDAVKVLVSNDEKRAREAWKILTVQNVENLYILAGGANFWLDIFSDQKKDAAESEKIPADGNDILKHTFKAAVGSAHPASDPGPSSVQDRNFDSKIKPIGPQISQSGGCG